MTHEERVRHHMYDTLEGIAEQSERIASLEELVRYMYRCFVRGHDWGPYCAGETVWVEQRMRELGVDA